MNHLSTKGRSLREVFARHPGQILTFESAWNSNRYVLHLNFHPTLHFSNLFQPWISGWQHWQHVVCSLLPWGFWPAFHRWGCCRCRTLQLAIKNRKKSHLHGRWSRLVAQCLCMEARNTVLSFREEPEVSHAPLTFWAGDNSREAQKQEKPRERTKWPKAEGYRQQAQHVSAKWTKERC